MPDTYDVLVLGSGLGGSITASILASRGWRVMLIDSASHPRFAIGEATTPDISFLMKIVAKKYDVPELTNLTTFHRLRDNVSAACGTKKSFTFLYHRPNEVQDPKESHQFPTLAPPFGPDCHFFRQDTDAYMVGVAMNYGADIRQRTFIEQIDLNDDGVRLTSREGEVFEGRFLVDGSGFRSPLAQKTGTREESTHLNTNSRSIFAHMIGVQLYDEISGGPELYGHAYRHAEGTLHHMFDGGWMWVIPFNNHQGHTNPLCSVGLMLDRKKFPESGLPPGEEFLQITARFPKVAEQFKNAKPVRSWVGTNRIQYSSSDNVGDRFCQLAHAGGFIDPLFSTGLNLTMRSIDQLIPQLEKSLTDDSFKKEDFQPISDEFRESLDFCDRVVSNAYLSLESFDLWDAWFRVWVASNFIGTTLNTNLYLNYENTGNREWLEKNADAPYSGILGSRFTPHRELFDAADAKMKEFQGGHITASEAADSIRSLFLTAKYLPKYFRWHDKNVRSTSTFTLPDLTRLTLWYNMFAPKEIRDELLSIKLSGVFTYTLKNIRQHRSRTNTRRGYIWDTISTRG